MKTDGVPSDRDRLSRWAGSAAGNALPRRHLEDALRDNLRVHPVIATAGDSERVDAGAPASSANNRFHAPDLVGHVAAFDGDSFQTDFKRL